MLSLSLLRRAFGEFLGTALLATVVIGSGIAAQQLSPGETGLELLENAVATGAGLPSNSTLQSWRCSKSAVSIPAVSSRRY
jgi:glycerol uptake facilitator-like aquaporin